MPLTVKSVVDSMPAYFNPDTAAGVDAVFQFVITGDQAAQYYLVVKDRKCQIVEGTHASPNTTLNMAADVFLDLMTRKISGTAAYFSGKLRVTGDLMLAQRLDNLFKTG